MTDLSPETRRLLDLAREGLSPDAAAVRRMRAKVAATTSATTGLALKLLLAVTLTVTAGTGLALHRRAAEPAAQPHIELASPPEAPVQVAAREAAPSDESLIVLEPNEPESRTGDVAAKPANLATKPASVAPRPASAVTAKSATVATAKPAPVAEPVEPPAITLAREVTLVDAAMGALRSGDPATALRAVHQHATETAGRGQLAEDAAAIEVEALCTLHDPSAPSALAAFDAHYPRSAQRARLSRHCP